GGSGSPRPTCIARAAASWRFASCATPSSWSATAAAARAGSCCSGPAGATRMATPMRRSARRMPMPSPHSFPPSPCFPLSHCSARVRQSDDGLSFSRRNSRMNTALWVAQTVLAALYVMAGLHKVTGEGPLIEKMMPGMSLALVRVIGLGEELVGFALGLPAAARGWAAVAGWAGAILAAVEVVVVVFNLL